MAMVIATLSFIGWAMVFTSSFPDQPFRTASDYIRSPTISSGREMPAPVFRTPVLPFCPAPDLSRFHHRVLGGPDDERRASAVRGGDHGLHLRRHACSKERDLVGMFGDEYRRRRACVSMLFPVAQTDLTTSQSFPRRRKNHEAYWKLFLRRGRGPGHGCAGAMGYCHCRSCRSWSGGPVNAFTLWKPEAVQITAGAQHVATFEKTPMSQRKYCAKCGGHLMTNHPTLGLVDVFAATLPTLCPSRPACTSTTPRRCCRCGMGCPN